MSRNQILEQMEVEFLIKRPNFRIGDTVRVHTRIIEGKRERTQVFSGVVIAKKGTGISETFTIYRQAYGCKMKRVFLLNSPRISQIEIEKSGKVRKAKLNYLIKATGKKSRVQQKIVKNNKETVVEEVKEEIQTESAEVNKPEEKKAKVEKPKKESKKTEKKKGE